MESNGSPQATAPANGSGEGLILLFGMPRSGTTWLGKIFDSHPDTLYRHEPDSYGRLNFMPMAPDPDQADAWREPLHDFVHGLPGLADTKVSATLPQFSKSYLSQPAMLWNAGAIRLAKLQARLRGEARARLLTPAPGEARPVWKSIESVARLGTISRLLPQARGVLIVRHPCGYVASVVRGKREGRFTDGESVGEDLGLLEMLCRTATAARYGIDLERLKAMQPIERLTWQWVLCNDKALEEIEAEGRVLPLAYERLCEAPLATARTLFRHAALDLHAETERFLSASTTQHRDRYYSVFKDPARAANAWREELPADIQQTIARITAGTRAGALFE